MAREKGNGIALSDSTAADTLPCSDLLIRVELGSALCSGGLEIGDDKQWSARRGQGRFILNQPQLFFKLTNFTNIENLRAKGN